MARNKLIVPGTILGYDDWAGAPHNWNNPDAVLGGECRAHFEIVNKYHIQGELYDLGDEGQNIFIVRDIVYP